ncbi:ENHANCER OF AG-4 protein 2-like [Dorcoceras hygrometricum]|uniref:ENHANCER OF AG-4 protein 2-like n=1 Tax=Dorcoceras hygrometricum TaxID=472368 RepID=A0A2Z7D293_9LAMI|nr:ENHANCER OF AG-4 protein 2-like [Dorcoceras hygrometricum]
MSLFDLQDVCIAIGSLATLDLPMVVDLIGIYGLKGPYCTLTMTDWFLQALSVIPRGSWGDVARRFTMIRWAGREESQGLCCAIGVILKSIPAITMREGVPFPISKILSMKTVNTYIATNQTIDARGQSEEPDSIGYPRMRASVESSTTKHRLLHASGPHPIPPPNDPKSPGHYPSACLEHHNISYQRNMVLRIADTSLKLGRPYPHFDGPID